MNRRSTRGTHPGAPPGAGGPCRGPGGTTRTTGALALLTGLALTVTAQPAAATPTQVPPTPPQASPGPAAVPPVETDTAPGTPPDVDVTAVHAHLTRFDAIATQNGGNRRAGGAGHTQSLAYVKARLEAAGFLVTEQTCTTCAHRSANLIADWPGGPSGEVVMFGAHLDGVSAGPGINDNASGSAALLENALVLAHKNPAMARHVRFAWWTGEEQGLQGSADYVSRLSFPELTAVKAYYNFDMVGSRNAGYFVNNIDSTAAAPMKAYWDSLHLRPEENVEGRGRSDDSSFRRAGVATSGYASGAGAIKTLSQAAKWGGTAGRSYDPCYHAACDTMANIDTTVLDRNSDGIAYTIWKTSVGGTAPGDGFSPSAGSVSCGGRPDGRPAAPCGAAHLSGATVTHDRHSRKARR